MSARTIHSASFQSLKRFWGRQSEIVVDDNKYAKISSAWAASHFTQLAAAARQQIATVLSDLAKFTRATLTTPTDIAAMHAMAAHFGMSCDAAPLDALIQAVPHLLAAGEQQAKGDDSATSHLIDFMDMVYLPYVWNLPARWSADWIFVDEAQDINAAQLAFALKCRAPNGRMLFVGDRHQAIYGFSGADNEAFDNIQRVTDAKEFQLSICYRCPRSHIALAQELVPAIEPRPDAPDGVVKTIAASALPQTVRKGDFILGRTTAPLIELCIRLMQDRIFAQVKGRDIGVNITQIVQEVTQISGYSWQRFGHSLEAFQLQQAEKIKQFDNAAAELVRLNDRIAAVRVCYQQFTASSAADLCVKVETVFKDERPDVLLCTIHRTKGLEADRIFLLEPENMPLTWPGQQPWELQQERNIKYVALTRARQELYIVPSANNA